MNHILLLITGFVSWWATGIDDVLVLGLIMKQQGVAANRAIIIGNLLGVALVLLVADFLLVGLLHLAPSTLHYLVLGMPLQRLLGVVPIMIGLRSVWGLWRNHEVDESESATSIKPKLSWLPLLFLGFQIYILNSTDDLTVHLGILGSVISRPISILTTVPLVSYGLGVLCGELTSIVLARWLARRMETQRALELAAAGAVMLVGTLILLGVFGK